jgi:hypothetical protein
VHQRRPGQHGRVREEELGLHPVGGVDDEVVFVVQRVDVPGDDGGAECFHPQAGECLGEAAGGGVDLGAADVRGAVPELAVEVGGVDDVGIGEGDVADAVPGERERRRAPEATRPHDQHPRSRNQRHLGHIQAPEKLGTGYFSPDPRTERDPGEK